MPDDRLTTVRETGIWEQTLRRSRFIGICRPIVTEDDARCMLEDVKNDYPGARHYVYAWRTNHPVKLQRHSDDGEPTGTGGSPVLSALLSENIDRGGVVVVRYFGGILLGASGLTRAYGSTALEAVRAAQPVQYVLCPMFRVETDYATYNRLTGQLERFGYEQRDPDFGATVSWLVGATDQDVEQLHQRIMDLSSGAATMAPAGSVWLEDKIISYDSDPL